MDEQNIGETKMEMNAKLADAARQLVRKGEIQEGEIYDIPGYRGMCLAIADDCAEIQAMEFITEGNRRYVIGPRLK